MAQSLNTRHAAIAAAVAAAGLFAMTLQSGSASASASVLSCRGSSPHSVLACCEREVKQNGMPGWMWASGGSCKSAIATSLVCKPSKGGDFFPAAVVGHPNGGTKCKFELVAVDKGSRRWIYGNDGSKDGGNNGGNTGGNDGGRNANGAPGKP